MASPAVVSGDGSAGKDATMITLTSSDNERFEVSEAAASLSQTISNMIEDDCAKGGIPLPNVTGSVLAKVMEYCNKHASSSSSSSEQDGGSSSAPPVAASNANTEDLKNFDKEFIEVDLAMLYDLLMAANFLNIKGLLDVATQKVADLIKGKTPEQIRHKFGIKNDFTPEEEVEIRKENSWAFEE